MPTNPFDPIRPGATPEDDSSSPIQDGIPPRRRRRPSANITPGTFCLLVVIVALASMLVFLFGGSETPAPPTNAPANASRQETDAGAPATPAAPAAPATPRPKVFFFPLLGEKELTAKFDLDEIKGLECEYKGYVQALVHFDDGTTAPASKGFDLKGKMVSFSGPTEKEVLIECKPPR